ncbi:MAG: SDR family NAD(P)-dependent oxidoreductase [Cyclobacteriaceae bacterium]
MSFKNWILVTGGTGFIGFALTKRLINLGYKVRVTTRKDSFSQDFQHLLDNTPESQLTVHKADICAENELEGLFSDVDCVFHAAALVNSTLPYEEFYKTNVIGTQNVCQQCIRNGIKKLVYISTGDVFGIPKKDEIFTEKSPYRYWSEPYPDTKIDATKLVKEISEKGVSTTIIYPSWVYGPGDQAFLPGFLGQIKDGFMPIWDRNKFHIGFVYIDDLIDAVTYPLIDDKVCENEDFLILDENSRTTLKDLCVRLGQLFDVKFLLFNAPYSFAYALGWCSQKLYQYKITKSLIMSTTDVKSFGHSFKFSSSKARTLLKWKPKTSLEQGVLNWKEWYEKREVE